MLVFEKIAARIKLIKTVFCRLSLVSCTHFPFSAHHSLLLKVKQGRLLKKVKSPFAKLKSGDLVRAMLKYANWQILTNADAPAERTYFHFELEVTLLE